MFLVSFCCKFQCHRSFSFKCGFPSIPRIALTPSNNRPALVDITALILRSAIVNCTFASCSCKAPSFYDFGIRLFLSSCHSIDQRNCNSPSFFCRKHLHQPGKMASHTSNSPNPSNLQTEDFSAPDGSVRSIAGSVKGYSDHLLFTVIFCHTGKNMCIMMLHFQNRKSKFFRNHCRIVFWMQITATTSGSTSRSVSIRRLFPSNAFTVRRSSRSPT